MILCRGDLRSVHQTFPVVNFEIKCYLMMSLSFIRKTIFLFVSLCLLSAVEAKKEDHDKSVALVQRVDWASFLKSRNLIWKKAPDSWKNAPFLGNGRIGMQLMQAKGNDRLLRLEVARMDAQEHMPYESSPDVAWAYARYRLPIGYFTLETEGKIKGWDLELDLWNAELSGTITTDKGKIDLKAYVHATQNMIKVDQQADGAESARHWKWNAYVNESPRWKNGGEKFGGPMTGVPGHLDQKESGVSVWLQPLRPSGQAATAWKEVSGNKSGSSLYVTIDHSFPENTAEGSAAKLVEEFVSQKPDVQQKTHRQWWNDYYPGAFLSLSDEYWDSFYWTQIYKIGAGMREDGPVLDLQGPWTCLPKNAWGGVWWNLNVQLTYWPCYTGNRLREASSLPATLRKYRDNLILNVEEKYQADSAALPRATGPDLRSGVGIPGDKRGAYSSETGALPWVCHTIFLHYKMTMDDAFLRDDVYPLLRRSINYYLHFLEKGDDGKWHLPHTLSPEYGTAPDCNYDLSLLRWGCGALIWSAERLKINDELLPKWKDVLENLVDYPVDGNGYMIGRGVPFSRTHRHFSHLFMVYPLHNVDTTKPEVAALVDKSALHWLNLKAGLSGYSFTGGASIYAKLGRGDDALNILDKVRPRIAPNTLYPEPWPVMETPLSALASMHDMLLQSWNGLVNVFAAVPTRWADVSFHDLRAEGAFLVSGERKAGKVRWVRIKSLAGEPLRLRVPIDSSAVLSGTGAASLKKAETGDWVGTPPQGSEILIALPGVNPEVSPVLSPKPLVRFGMP